MVKHESATSPDLQALAVDKRHVVIDGLKDGVIATGRLRTQKRPSSLSGLDNLLEQIGDVSSIARQVAALGLTAESVIRFVKNKNKKFSDKDFDFNVYANHALRELIVNIDRAPIRTDGFVELLGRAANIASISEADLELYKDELTSAIKGMWSEQNFTNFLAAHTDIGFEEASLDEDAYHKTDIFVNLNSDRRLALDIKSNPRKLTKDAEIMYIVTEDGYEEIDPQSYIRASGTEVKPKFYVSISESENILIQMDIGLRGAPPYVNSLRFDDTESKTQNRQVGFHLHELLETIADIKEVTRNKQLGAISRV